MPVAKFGVSQTDVDRQNALVRADPDIQRVLAAEGPRLQQTRDKGGDARAYQNGIRDLITHIAQQKGLIPAGKYFVNPNDGNLEPSHGWSGLAGWQKALAIGGVAAATIATAGAFGAFSGPVIAGSAGATTSGGAAATTATGASGFLAPAAGGWAAPTFGAAASTAAPAAAAIAPSVAPTVAATSSWLAPALKYGLPVAAGLTGQIIQSKAENNAAKLQAGFTQQALDDARAERDYQHKQEQDAIARQQEVQGYNRQQYADYSKSLEPYRQRGLTASERLAGLLKQRYG